MSKKIPEVYTAGSISEIGGPGRQAIYERLQRGTMPSPDVMVNGRPAWTKETLKRAGLIK